MKIFKRTNNGYSYIFYKEDMLGKLEALDLLEELINKITNTKKEITDTTPIEYLIELDKKMETTNTMINHLERLVTIGYSKFGTTVYKGYIV